MRIHLDHNATTPLRPEARERWLSVTDELAGNASGLHAGGRRARAVIDDARAQVADALGTSEEAIIFTSGGTESNNLALAGVVLAQRGHDPRLVVSAAEHSSVLLAARALAERDARLHELRVTAAGLPDLEELERVLEGDPVALVSVMAANNEVGSVPDLQAVRARLDAAPGPRALFHSDAVQALGRLPIDFERWGVDLASFSAHKVGGPVGVGVLCRRPGTPLEPLFHGGGHEGGYRPGTEDVAGIAAAAEAIRLAVEEQAETSKRLFALTSELWHALRNELPELELVGPGWPEPATSDVDDAMTSACGRLPNTLCVRVPRTDGKVLVTRLDLAGIEASAGSACASGSIEPSHVLLAMGLDENAARSGLRLSLGRNTSREECMQAVDLLRDLLASSHAT